MNKPDISPQDIQAVFGLPPEEVIAYFERKGFVLSWDWYDVWKEAHAQSFTVAKVMRLDVLSDIYQALDDDFRNGGSFSKFAERLEPLLKAKGWWGIHAVAHPVTGEISNVAYGTPWRLETIYEVNMQTAYMAGRYQGMIAATHYAPWWEYSAVMDNRTRPTHAALNGLVFRFDDPFWQTWYPPNGFRCRCRVIPRTDIEKSRGDFVVSSGVGRMESTIRSLNKLDGSFADIKMTGYRDPISRKLITPDIGWDYNPGAAGANLKKLYQDKLQAAPAALSKKAKEHD